MPKVRETNPQSSFRGKKLLYMWGGGEKSA